MSTEYNTIKPILDLEFLEYDAAEDDKYWETQSHEEGRRQEAVEQYEHQMEEYERQCAANDLLPTSSDQCKYCLKTLKRCWCDESDVDNYYPDLSRAIFEMNSVPTSDPNVRISYNVSHPVPTN